MDIFILTLVSDAELPEREEILSCPEAFSLFSLAGRRADRMARELLEDDLPARISVEPLSWETCSYFVGGQTRAAWTAQGANHQFLIRQVRIDCFPD